MSIGVSETGTEPPGLSLQRSGGDVWSGPSANTFGACNDNEPPPPPPPPPPRATGPTVSHTYASAGKFTVRLVVTDVRGLVDTAVTTTAVATTQQALAGARERVAQLVSAGGLSTGDGAWHVNKLDNAAKLLDQATVTAAVNQLDEVVRRLERSGLGASDLADAVRRIIQSLTS